MDPDAFYNPNGPHFMLLVGGILCLLALVAFFVLSRQIRQSRHEAEHLDHRLNTLWHELDTLRLDPVPGEATADSPSPAMENERSPEHAAAERAVYEKIWPTAWSLHDKVGTFLRAIDHNDPVSESRMAARHAALDLRKEANQVKPFVNESIDRLLHQLLDAEVKAHLAACQYLDNRQEHSSSEQETTYRREWQQHDQQAGELLNQLARAIRRRVLA